jgi:hypothetical protein
VEDPLSFRKVTRIWLPLALVVTAMSLLVYLVSQQAFRQAANDPQVQLAEDGARALGQGDPVNPVLL